MSTDVPVNVVVFDCVDLARRYCFAWVGNCKLFESRVDLSSGRSHTV